MKRLILAVLLLVGLAAQASATTWNPSDKSSGITLSNGNLTATSGSGIADVRATTSKSTGKFCWEATASTVGVDWGLGLANSSYPLAVNGLGSDINSFGFYPGGANPNAQIAYFNSTQVTSGTAQASVNGEKITECADLGAGQIWVTDAAMRTNYGTGAWNNSGTCNPTVACGISLSGFTGPYFIAYTNRLAGVAVLNTVGPFAVATPAGFSVWDSSNLIPDLSNAAAHPVTGFPANKIAYSIHISPFNVAGATPDTPLATVTPIWNTYFGNLVKNGTAPVLNLSTGCACDGSNGNLTDDQAFMGNWVAYANGLASGGPAFTGAQQPMGNAWYSWGNFSGSNPNGTLNSDGTLKGAATGQAGGQAFYWSQLLYTATAPVVPAQTTWNGLDKSSGITLSNNNLTATTTAATRQSVRATTSKATGKACFGVTASTITTNWAVGLSNSAYNLTLTAGLGSDTTGIAFTPNNASGLQGVFFGNVKLSSGTPTSANGETAMLCADFDNARFWATDSAMRSTLGSSVWNNTVGCDPTNTGCAVSFSGLTGQLFPTFNDLQSGGVAVLNTTTATMPFTLPVGFNPWDLPLTGGKPLILIFGANDNGAPPLAERHTG